MSQTDDDAARLTEDIDGSICFWRGDARETCLYPESEATARANWLKQWDASAEEARRFALQHRDLLIRARTIRSALEQGAATLQRVLNNTFKLPPRLKLDCQNSRRVIEDALAYCDAPSATGAGGNDNLAPSSNRGSGEPRAPA